MTTIATRTPGRTVAPLPVAHALPVNPRRPGWRAGAAAALVASATSELRAGRSPYRDVRSLAELGHGGTDRGIAAAEELDRRLDAALTGLADERTAAPLLDDERADELLAPLFDHLGPDAVTGRPHPGEWVASSVDVLPCAVHGYEAGPVDCLRRSVREHLLLVVDGTGASPATARLRTRVARPEPDPAGDAVLSELWTGVAALAAWQTYAATR